MPTERVSAAAAVVKGKIYVMGGNGDYHNTNEMYDPTTDTWATKAPMPTPRKSFGIAVYQNKINVMGGLTESDGSYYDGITGVNEVYDPATNTWENKTSMPTRRIGINANVVEDKIYVIGGKNASGWIDEANEVYDPATDTWTTKAPIPTQVSFYASAVIDNKIYVIGGYNGSVYGDLTQIYDPETDTWSNGAPIPSPAMGAGAGATTGVWAPKRIYVIGAIQPYGIADQLGNIIVFNNVQNQIYDPEKDAWSTGAALPNARILFGVAVVDDILYAIGGTNSGLFSSCVTFGDNQQYTPYGYGTIPSVISVVSPENKNYTSGNVSLAFAVNKPAVWMGYSLDGQDNVTITGNATLSGLSSGLHNVTVYAKDEFENTGASETIYFRIAKPFPTMLVAVAVVAVIVANAGLLVYFKKRKHETQETVIARVH
jgi:N-acetylneuraminic acid mutarotase